MGINREIPVEEMPLRGVTSEVYTEEAINTIRELKEIRNLMRSHGLMGYNKDHNEHYGNVAARFNPDLTICTATQTSGIEEIVSNTEITPEFFPIIFSVEDNVKWYGLSPNKKPSVEGSTHVGFLKGDKSMKFSTHGHSPLLYNHFKNPDNGAVLLDENASYGSRELMNAAKVAGHRRTLQETPYGQYRIAIPLGHEPGFFIIGSSSNALKYGILRSLDQAVQGLNHRLIKEFEKLDLESIKEEDHIFSTDKPLYFP